MKRPTKWAIGAGAVSVALSAGLSSITGAPFWKPLELGVGVASSAGAAYLGAKWFKSPLAVVGTIIGLNLAVGLLMIPFLAPAKATELDGPPVSLAGPKSTAAGLMSALGLK
jgi:hypothetical protein